jgi:hypothetical protein
MGGVVYMRETIDESKRGVLGRPMLGCTVILTRVIFRGLKKNRWVLDISLILRVSLIKDGWDG